jgi:hypothetical protein
VHFARRNINWTAPEVLLDNGNEVCELADVWSLAVVGAEILSGEIPFDSPHCRQLTIEAFVDALGNNLRPGLPVTCEDWMRDAVSCLSAYLPEHFHAMPCV